jgi:hypothetical protein
VIPTDEGQFGKCRLLKDDAQDVAVSSVRAMLNMKNPNHMSLEISMQVFTLKTTSDREWLGEAGE